MSDNNLQYYLCKLITNPCLLEQNLFSIEEVLQQFRASSNTKKLMLEFFKQHGNRFFSAMRVLKKRRRDNVYNNAPIISRYFDHNVLDEQWDQYMSYLMKNQITPPQNPLLESLYFIDFIEQNRAPSSAQDEDDVLKYERLRNSVIANYSQHQNTNFIIHPSFIISEFNNGALEIIQNIIVEKSSGVSGNSISQSTNMILFFKNWIKGGITAAKIPNALCNLLEAIRYETSLNAAKLILTSDQYNLGGEEATALLTTFLELGIAEEDK